MSREHGASEGMALEPDQEFPWDGECPYVTLSRRIVAAGGKPIGPESTARAVQDALFSLQAIGRPTSEEMAAWHTLRRSERRVAVDFFLYDLPRFDRASLDAALRDRPMPPVELDLRRLVEHAVSPLHTSPAPQRLAVEDVAWRELIDAYREIHPPISIVEAAPGLEEMMGDDEHGA